MSIGSCSHGRAGCQSGLLDDSCSGAIQLLANLQAELKGLTPGPCPCCGEQMLAMLAAPSAFSPALLQPAIGPAAPVVTSAALDSFSLVMLHNQKGDDFGVAVRFWLARAREAHVDERQLAWELSLALQGQLVGVLDGATSLMMLNCLKYLAVTHVGDGCVSDLDVWLRPLLAPGVPEALRDAVTDIFVLVAYRNLELGYDSICQRHLDVLLAMPLPQGKVVARLADLLVTVVNKGRTPTLRLMVLNRLMALANCLLRPGADPLRLGEANRFLRPALRRVSEKADVPNGEWQCLRAIAGTLLLPEMSERGVREAALAVGGYLDKAARADCPAAAALRFLTTGAFDGMRRIAAAPNFESASAEPLPALRYAQISTALSREFTVGFLRQNGAMIREVAPHLSAGAQRKFLFWLGKILADDKLPPGDRLVAWNLVHDNVIPTGGEDLACAEGVGEVLFFVLERVAGNSLLPRNERDEIRDIILIALRDYPAYTARSVAGFRCLSAVASLAKNERLDPDERQSYREVLLQPRVVEQLLPLSGAFSTTRQPFGAGAINALVHDLELLHNSDAMIGLVRWLGALASHTGGNADERRAAREDLLRMARAWSARPPAVKGEIIRAIITILANNELPVEERAPFAGFCLSPETLADQSDEVYSQVVNALGVISGDAGLDMQQAMALAKLQDLFERYAELPVTVRTELIYAMRDAIDSVEKSHVRDNLARNVLLKVEGERDEAVLAAMVSTLGVISRHCAAGPLTHRSLEMLMGLARRFATLPPKVKEEVVHTFGLLAGCDTINPAERTPCRRTLYELGAMIPRDDAGLMGVYIGALANVAQIPSSSQEAVKKLAELFTADFERLPETVRSILLTHLQNMAGRKTMVAYSHVRTFIARSLFWNALRDRELDDFIRLVGDWAVGKNADAAERVKAQGLLCQILREKEIKSDAFGDLFISVVDGVVVGEGVPKEEKRRFLHNLLTLPVFNRQPERFSSALKNSLTMLSVDSLATGAFESPSERERLASLFLNCADFQTCPFSSNNETDQVTVIRLLGSFACELSEGASFLDIRRRAQRLLLSPAIARVALGHANPEITALYLHQVNRMFRDGSWTTPDDFALGAALLQDRDSLRLLQNTYAPPVLPEILTYLQFVVRHVGFFGGRTEIAATFTTEWLDRFFDLGDLALNMRLGEILSRFASAPWVEERQRLIAQDMLSRPAFARWIQESRTSVEQPDDLYLQFAGLLGAVPAISPATVVVRLKDLFEEYPRRSAKVRAALVCALRLAFDSCDNGVRIVLSEFVLRQIEQEKDDAVLAPLVAALEPILMANLSEAINHKGVGLLLALSRRFSLLAPPTRNEMVRVLGMFVGAESQQLAERTALRRTFYEVGAQLPRSDAQAMDEYVRGLVNAARSPASAQDGTKRLLELFSSDFGRLPDPVRGNLLLAVRGLVSNDSSPMHEQVRNFMMRSAFWTALRPDELAVFLPFLGSWASGVRTSAQDRTRAQNILGQILSEKEIQPGPIGDSFVSVLDGVFTSDRVPAPEKDRLLDRLLMLPLFSQPPVRGGAALKHALATFAFNKLKSGILAAPEQQRLTSLFLGCSDFEAHPLNGLGEADQLAVLECLIGAVHERPVIDLEDGVGTVESDRAEEERALAVRLQALRLLLSPVVARFALGHSNREITALYLRQLNGRWLSSLWTKPAEVDLRLNLLRDPKMAELLSTPAFAQWRQTIASQQLSAERMIESDARESMSMEDVNVDRR